MTSWTPPTIVGHLDGADPILLEWIKASGVTCTRIADKDDWVLRALNGQLVITRPDGVAQGVDFTQGKSRHRSGAAAAGAPQLKKSLGLTAFRKKHGGLPTVIDATGGWGQDAWAIASLGCEVSVIEQHPVVHAILGCGLQLAALDSACADTAARITLLKGDANTWLSKIQADVIYLDPMYPHRGRKKADSKKGMQILQRLLGPGDQTLSSYLLNAAVCSNASRVVVKRPKGADALVLTIPLKGQKFVIESPNTRYDIYQKSAPMKDFINR